jgi:hypothetical protein
VYTLETQFLKLKFFSQYKTLARDYEKQDVAVGDLP